jgi:hypothetical protein
MDIDAVGSQAESAISIPDTNRHPDRNVLFRFMQEVNSSPNELYGFNCILVGTSLGGFRNSNHPVAYFGVANDGTRWGVGVNLTTITGQTVDPDPENGITEYYYTQTITAGVWYWGRAEVRGNMISAKVWKDDAGIIEPSGWSLSVGFAGVPKSGWVGVGVKNRDDNVRLDYIRIAYGGAYA